MINKRIIPVLLAPRDFYDFDFIILILIINFSFSHSLKFLSKKGPINKGC